MVIDMYSCTNKWFELRVCWKIHAPLVSSTDRWHKRDIKVEDISHCFHSALITKMGHEELKNKIRVAAQVINAISFIGLLCTSWFFIYKNVEEFFNDRTSFTASREPLRAKDLPSATICFSASTKMVYGTDFTVQILANKINSTQKEWIQYYLMFTGNACPFFGHLFYERVNDIMWQYLMLYRHCTWNGFPL